jgi:DNA-binding MarR family transcriptional regulator
MDKELDRPQAPVSRYRSALHERLTRGGQLPEDAADRADLVFNLAKLFNRMSQDFESVHRPLGWTWAGFRIMNMLWVTGRMEARELARVSGSSRAAISAVLGTLERDGLVARERSESDRRQVLVRLTVEGTRRLESGIEAQVRRDRQWFAVLSEDEQRAFGQMLQRLADQVVADEDHSEDSAGVLR